MSEGSKSKGEGTLSYDEIKDAIPKRNGISLGAEKDNFIVALDDKHIYTLTAGAYYVWMRCSGERTVKELIKEISGELSANPETAMSEEELRSPIMLILGELSKAGLVTFMHK